MTTSERVLARIMFQNLIGKSDGDSFERLFTQIMNYAEADFEQIKPWGKIGDRKNDGFIRSKGVYYQVFAPEDIRKSYSDTISKLKKDFNGLLSNPAWKPINEFYFLVNDKYLGVNADASNVIANLIKINKLKKGKILTAKDLENKLFALDDDIIIRVIGFMPDTNEITQIDFSALNQVISHIMQLEVIRKQGEIKFPDWDEKIKFNYLSENSKRLLEEASFNLGDLNEYLANEEFLAEALQKHLSGIYNEIKVNFKGDNLLWEMIQKCFPRNEQHFFSSIMTILAKYFESCDIFEEPKNKEC